LICGSCFARILQNTNLEEGINEARKYDDTSATKEKLINANSTDEIMRIAVKYGMKNKKIDRDKQRKLEEIEHKYFESTNDIQLDEERLKTGAQAVREIASSKSLNDMLHEEKLSEEDQELLRKYYNANELLVACLESECRVDDRVIKDLYSTLLLPSSDAKIIEDE
jgi:hypothetical protein